MGMADSGPILLCYDGSDGSARAIGEAGRLFPGAHAVVVHVSHLPNMYTTGYAGAPALPGDVLESVEEVAREQANEILEQGEEIARQAGLDPEGISCVTPSAPWRQLLGAAEDVHAKLIVAGSRGRGGVKSLVLGSTSQALAHRCRVPLLIVPPDRERSSWTAS
jgi:nucleotide-binding universal stress UspA family protein